MEFIKVGKNYMIKGGNGRIISEKEKIELDENISKIDIAGGYLNFYINKLVLTKNVLEEINKMVKNGNYAKGSDFLELQGVSLKNVSTAFMSLIMIILNIFWN